MIMIHVVLNCDSILLESFLKDTLHLLPEESLPIIYKEEKSYFICISNRNINQVRIILIYIENINHYVPDPF